MSKVYLLTGIIASGKSTWAKQQVDSKTVIVSKDKLREMLYGQYGYKVTDEPFINELAKLLIKTLLKSGMDVIIDECWDTMTNGARKRLMEWVKTICPNTQIYIIYFSSIIGNVKRRMLNNYGNTSKEIWESVKVKMLAEFEPPDLYDDKIDIGERNE